MHRLIITSAATLLAALAVPLAHTQIERLTLPEIGAKADDPVVGTIAMPHVFRVDHPVGGHELFTHQVSASSHATTETTPSASGSTNHETHRGDGADDLFAARADGDEPDCEELCDALKDAQEAFLAAREALIHAALDLSRARRTNNQAQAAVNEARDTLATLQEAADDICDNGTPEECDEAHTAINTQRGILADAIDEQRNTAAALTSATIAHATAKAAYDAAKAARDAAQAAVDEAECNCD